MKNFTFFDKCGNSHTFRPVQFANTASIEHFLLPYSLSDSVRSDFAEYARKAHAYMVARKSAREAQKKLFKSLADKLSYIVGIYLPGDFIGDVLKWFSIASGLSSFPYVLHCGFCRGYVPAAERKSPPVEFYFGTFGGGFAYYEHFSTRYRYRHLIILSDWWFLNGEIDKNRLQRFADWCSSQSDECPF